MNGHLVYKIIANQTFFIVIVLSINRHQEWGHYQQLSKSVLNLNLPNGALHHRRHGSNSEPAAWHDKNLDELSSPLEILSYHQRGTVPRYADSDPNKGSVTGKMERKKCQLALSWPSLDSFDTDPDRGASFSWGSNVLQFFQDGMDPRYGY